MKISNKIAALALMITGFAFQANAQDNEATGDASATVVAPITLTAVDPMAFGDVAVESGTAGTIAIANNGDLTATGGAQLISSTGQAASFDVTGEGGYAYAVTLPSAAVSLELSTDALVTMTLDSFVDNSGGVLAAEGTDSFNVGAILNLGAGQASGLYNGTFTVSVDYN